MNMRPVEIKPIALANAIYFDNNYPIGYGAYERTLKNIKDCLAEGDIFFCEPVDDGYRVSTDTGASWHVKTLGWVK